MTRENLLVTVATVLFTASLYAQDTIPLKTKERLDQLAARHAAAVERAVAPLRKVYSDELTRMRGEYTKAGDLPSALAVDQALKQELGGTAGSLPPQVAVAPPKTEPKQTAAVTPPVTGPLSRADCVMLLPKPNREPNYKIEKWLEGKVWKIGNEGYMRFDKGGKGRRFTRYAGLELTLVWKVMSDGLVDVSGVGNAKLIRMTSESAGVGIMGSKPQEGVFNVSLVPEGIPELK